MELIARPRIDARIAAALELARAEAPTLAVADLAVHAGYSPFRFTRLFAEQTGIGPGQFLTALRMNAARMLLLAEDHPVIDVATEVGFSSLSSFSRRFRAVVGVPPAQLRQLADRVADRPPAPFALSPSSPHRVRIGLRLPASIAERGDPLVWLGWFPHPAPIGLPHAGVLVRGRESVELPLAPGAPWLLGFAVRPHAEVSEHLGIDRHVVALHPSPLTEPCTVELHFRDAVEDDVPVLVALPSLCRR